MSPPDHPLVATVASSADRFARTVVRSRLLTPDRVDAARRPGADARALADALIAAGGLTHYQADKLLRGLWQGLVLGPFHVLAPLGRGGMGAVYLARRGPAGADLVALKVLHPEKLRESDIALRRFRREIELGRRLADANVARTLDDGYENGVHYVVMEYVPGASLKRTVDTAGPMTVPAAARVFAAVAAGLAHAHERGLIHRDLKPSNVMVTPDGGAKVLDLGLALLVDETADPAVVGGRGYILGSADYIAPEQGADSTDVGPWSDLYSLGGSLFFALTGSPPFPGGTALQKIGWHRTAPPPTVRSLNPTVSPDVDALVAGLLAKRPADRPRSADEVRERLSKWVDPVPPAVVSPAPAANVVVEAVDRPDYDPGLWAAPTGEPLPPDDTTVPAPARPLAWREWLAVVAAAGAVLVVLLRGR